jgi:hypothetical protein
VITKPKAEVVRIIVDVFCKLLLVISCIGVYIAAVRALIMNPSLPLGIFDSVLTIGIGRVITHYFPARRK